MGRGPATRRSLAAVGKLLLHPLPLSPSFLVTALGQHCTLPLPPGHPWVIPCPLFFLKVHSVTWLWGTAEGTEPSEPDRPDGPCPGWACDCGVSPGRPPTLCASQLILRSLQTVVSRIRCDNALSKVITNRAGCGDDDEDEDEDDCRDGRSRRDSTPERKEPVWSGLPLEELLRRTFLCCPHDSS